MKNIYDIKNIERDFFNLKFEKGEKVSVKDFLIVTINDYKGSQTKLTIDLNSREYNEDLNICFSDEKILKALEFLEEKFYDVFKSVSVVLMSDYYGYNTLTSKILYDFGEYPSDKRDDLLNEIRNFLGSLKENSTSSAPSKEYVDDKKQDLENMISTALGKKAKYE